LLSALFVLVSVAQEAGTDGIRDGMSAGQDASDWPSVTVFSESDLAISVVGVTTVRISESDSKFHFKYEGMHALLWDGNTYILVGPSWRRGQPIVVLHDDPTLRFEVSGDLVKIVRN
jgi:hypothetical protein